MCTKLCATKARNLVTDFLFCYGFDEVDHIKADAEKGTALVKRVFIKTAMKIAFPKVA